MRARKLAGDDELASWWSSPNRRRSVDLAPALLKNPKRGADGPIRGDTSTPQDLETGDFSTYEWAEESEQVTSSAAVAAAMNTTANTYISALDKNSRLDVVVVQSSESDQQTLDNHSKIT